MELKNICKSFDGRQVLSDVSLVVPKGSRVLISAFQAGERPRC